MNTVVPPDQIAIFGVFPVDASGTARAATGTIAIDDYMSAYVAKNAGGQVVVVTRSGAIPAPGATKAVNVSISGNDAAGNALPVLTLGFDLQGPPLPPNATHFVTANMAVRDKIGYPVPGDPGSPSIPL